MSGNLKIGGVSVEFAIEDKTFQAKLNKLGGDMQKFTSTMKNNMGMNSFVKQLKDINNPADKTTKTIKALEDQLTRYQAQARKSGAPINKDKIEEAKKLIDQYKNKLIEAEKAQSNLNKKSTVFDTLGKKIKGFALMAGGAIATAFSIKALADFAKKSIQTASQFEQFTTQFEVMTGSAMEAGKIMEKLEKQAAATPFEMSQLASGTQKLMAFGLQSDEAINSLMRLGDIAGGDAQKLETLTLSFGKMSAKGKADLESLNMMIEAGVPILDTLADQYKVSKEELFKMISAGKVSFKDINDSVIKMTSSGGQYFNMMAKQAETLQGLSSTLKDNWSLLGKDIFEGAVPYIKSTQKALIELIGKTRDSMMNGEKFFSSKSNTIIENKNLVELAREYENLAKKTKLSADEKDRVKTIQNDLITKMPDLKEAIDKETGSLDINSDAWKDRLSSILMSDIKGREELRKKIKDQANDMEKSYKKLQNFFSKPIPIPLKPWGQAIKELNQIEKAMNQTKTTTESFNDLVAVFDTIIAKVKDYNKIINDPNSSEKQIDQANNEKLAFQQKAKEIENIINTTNSNVETMKKLATVMKESGSSAKEFELIVKNNPMFKGGFFDDIINNWNTLGTEIETASDAVDGVTTPLEGQISILDDLTKMHKALGSELKKMKLPADELSASIKDLEDSLYDLKSSKEIKGQILSDDELKKVKEIEIIIYNIKKAKVEEAFDGLVESLQESIEPANAIDKAINELNEKLENLKQHEILSQEQIDEAKKLIDQLKEKLKLEASVKIFKEEYSGRQEKYDNLESASGENTSTKRDGKTAFSTAPFMKAWTDFWKDPNIKNEMINSIVSAVGQGVSDGYQLQSGNLQKEYDVKIKSAESSGNENEANRLIAELEKNLSKLSEESKNASDGVRIAKDSINNFAEGFSKGGPIMGLINMVIGWILEVITVAISFSKTLGKSFAIIGQIFKIVGSVVGIFSELGAQLSGANIIISFIVDVLRLFGGAIEFVAGLLEIAFLPITMIMNTFGSAVDWVIEQMRTWINGVVAFMKAWGIEVGISRDFTSKPLEDTKPQETNDKTAQELLQEQINLQESQLDKLNSLKSNIEKIYDIQKRLIEMELEKQKQDWDKEMNTKLYSGLLSSMQQNGSTFGSFDFSLYQKLLNPDGSVNANLGAQLLKRLSTEQLDKGKIFDQNALAQLSSLIENLISNQEFDTNYAAEKLSLENDYIEAQNNLNGLMIEMGYTVEDLGSALYGLVDGVRKTSFKDFEEKLNNSMNQVIVFQEKILTESGEWIDGVLLDASGKITGVLTGFQSGVGGIITGLDGKVKPANISLGFFKEKTDGTLTPLGNLATQASNASDKAILFANAINKESGETIYGVMVDSAGKVTGVITSLEKDIGKDGATTGLRATITGLDGKVLEANTSIKAFKENADKTLSPLGDLTTKAGAASTAIGTLDIAGFKTKIDGFNLAAFQNKVNNFSLIKPQLDINSSIAGMQTKINGLTIPTFPAINPPDFTVLDSNIKSLSATISGVRKEIYDKSDVGIEFNARARAKAEWDKVKAQKLKDLGSERVRQLFNAGTLNDQTISVWSSRAFKLNEETTFINENWQKFHDGGYVSTDSFNSNKYQQAMNSLKSYELPAVLKNKEFVINDKAVESIGRGALELMNGTGKIPTSGANSSYSFGDININANDMFQFAEQMQKAMKERGFKFTMERI